MRTLKLHICSIALILSWMVHGNAQQLNRTVQQKSLPSFQHHYKTAAVKNKYLYSCVLTSPDDLSLLLSQFKSVVLKQMYPPAALIIIECTPADAALLASKPMVKWIDVVQQPKEELIFGATDFTANNISTIQHRYAHWNAGGISISVKEQRFDTLDIDVKNRILPSSFGAPTVSTHASVMTTLIAGAGNTSLDTKGAAWGASLSTASFLNLIPEPDPYYQSSSITVQNHSYGTVVEHYYGAEAAAYDISVRNNPSLVHVFSAGNSGITTPASGNYAGIPAYANLTGNFKQFKNGILVGHIDSVKNVLPPSSRGPAYDGRLKPELVAFGEDGSSGAAALTSGVAAVLQQAYKEKNNNIAAPASLVKAVLLNSADDVDAPGIDFKSGFGNLNAYKAVQTIEAGRYLQGTVAPGGEQKFTVNVPAGIRKLKITLVWTDVPATINAPKALVNDLDLTLVHTHTNTTWLPWVLNPAPVLSSLQQLPVRQRDSLNNAEQITIDDPAAGTYEISVKAFSIATANQSFSLAYQLDTGNVVEWLFPTGSDHLPGNQTNILRFISTYTNTNGLLELSTDNGNSWQTISNTLPLKDGFFKWSTPELFTKALLRITVNGTVSTSDTFTISNRLTVSTGYNCPDSVLVYWNKIPQASAYRVYTLGSTYLQSFVTTPDTSLLVAKSTITNKYFAVQPLLQTKAANRSNSLNYEADGTGCYIRNFYAVLTAFNTGDLQLELGTTYRLKTISVEKQRASGYETFVKVSATAGPQYRFNDPSLINGTNSYRVVLELMDGRKIYSDIAVLYYNGSFPAVVYPNPAPRNGSITVLVEQDNNLLFELINNTGSVVLTRQLNDYPQQIALLRLPKGIYYYRVLKAGTRLQTGKLVIY